MRSSTQRLLLLTLLLLLVSAHSYSQDSASHNFIDKIISFPDKVFGRIDKETNRLEQKLNHQTERYLNKLERREEKLKRKLWKEDSTKAKEVFGDVKERYLQLRQAGKEAQRQGGTKAQFYSGRMDSLQTAMKFLQNNPLLKEGTAIAQQVNGNLTSITNLQNSLNATDYVRKQILARQQQLRQQLQNIGLVKEFRKFRKEVYYYQQQLREYREALNNPKLFGEKLLTVAQKIPAFQEFFRNNSELARMFNLPPAPSQGGGVAASFAGLQTRASVQNIIQQRFGTAAFTPQQAGSGGGYIQQQVQTAQNELQQLKNKVNKWGIGGDGDIEMPDYKTNPQKTKSFLKRIEWGTNLQTTKGTYFFPVTSDIGLSAGYKLNDKSIIGIGASYKVGWGRNWQSINITNQGAGLRTFIDWKLPLTLWRRLGGGLWISGGAEMNYRPSPPTPLLQERGFWQQSALLGISKKYNIGKKMKGNAQVLYDFLWRQQRPLTQPVVFRVGYGF